MITKKAQGFISENSSSIGLLLKVSDFIDVYHVDDDFETKGHDKEYVVGTITRYKYQIKKKKGSPIPPHIELPELEQLAESFLQEGIQPLPRVDTVVEEVITEEKLTKNTTDDFGSSDEDLFSTGEINKNTVESEILYSSTPAEEKKEDTEVALPQQPDSFDENNRTFVINRVVIVPIERKTSARVTDYLFHNNKLLSGEELRGVVDAYFQK